MEMILETTCILCPNGCDLSLYKNQDVYVVEGNLCKKGIEFAIGEFEHPVRMVTSTVKTVYKKRPRVSVRTDQPISKELIFRVMEEINALVVDWPLQRGEVLIKEVCGTDASIIATSCIWEDELTE